MKNQYEKGEKVKLSKHFDTTEFDCHCKNKTCTITYIDDELIEKLEALRNKWNCPINIISGFRCSAHNVKQGGKIGSRHLIGEAADIDISELIDKVGLTTIVEDCQVFGGVGLNQKEKFIHVDVRKTHARWTY